MFILLFPFLVFAASEAPVDKSCARMMLSSIYAAEKSYHAEFERYSDSLKEIGYEKPVDSSCNSWNVDIRIFQGGAMIF